MACHLSRWSSQLCYATSTFNSSLSRAIFKIVEMVHCLLAGSVRKSTLPGTSERNEKLASKRRARAVENVITTDVRALPLIIPLDLRHFRSEREVTWHGSQESVKFSGYVRRVPVGRVEIGSKITGSPDAAGMLWFVGPVVDTDNLVQQIQQ